MTNSNLSARAIFEGQILHLAAISILLVLVIGAASNLDFRQESFLGLSTTAWLWLVVVNAILHQVYVWLCWRLELHGKWLTRRFGNAAFQIFAIGFGFLFIGRPLFSFALGWSNYGSLDISPLAGYLLAGLCFGFAAYLMFCVKTYFSFKRAFGIDHFDESYRSVPLVRRGIFRLSSNAMYVFGFLMLWVPAFLFRSEAALITALFSHTYIWVHHFATEKPDMRVIYERP